VDAVALYFSNLFGLVSVVGFLFVSLLTTSAAAVNIINLDPANVLTDVGNDISFDLIMNFDASLQGGGVEITYDPSKLLFQSFVFDPMLVDDAFFRCWPVAATQTCNELLPPTIEVGWGVLFSPALTGVHTIGSLTFTAIASGAGLVSVMPSVGFPGPFFDILGNPIQTDLQGASVSIGLIALPEPGTGLLVAIGLFGLCVERNRIHATE
jgi:hypothetical protein